jgi:hypothetical protein
MEDLLQGSDVVDSTLHYHPLDKMDGMGHPGLVVGIIRMVMGETDKNWENCGL